MSTTKDIKIGIKIGKKIIDTKKDKALNEALVSFTEVKREIDLLNEKLKASKEVISAKSKDILKNMDETTVTLITGDINVKVSFGWDINISDEATLTELLGDRFDDLVTTKVSYTPTAKLKEMSLVDDGLKKCLTIKEKAPTVAISK